MARHSWQPIGHTCSKCGLNRDTRKEAPSFTWGDYKPQYYYWRLLRGKFLFYKKLPPCPD